jgi:hypothetical protein
VISDEMSWRRSRGMTQRSSVISMRLQVSDREGSPRRSRSKRRIAPSRPAAAGSGGYREGTRRAGLSQRRQRARRSEEAPAKWRLQIGLKTTTFCLDRVENARGPEKRRWKADWIGPVCLQL